MSNRDTADSILRLIEGATAHLGLVDCREVVAMLAADLSANAAAPPRVVGAPLRWQIENVADSKARFMRVFFATPDLLSAVVKALDIIGPMEIEEPGTAQIVMLAGRARIRFGERAWTVAPEVPA